MSFFMQKLNPVDTTTENVSFFCRFLCCPILLDYIVNMELSVEIIFVIFTVIRLGYWRFKLRKEAVKSGELSSNGTVCLISNYSKDRTLYLLKVCTFRSSIQKKSSIQLKLRLNKMNSINSISKKNPLTECKNTTDNKDNKFLINGLCFIIRIRYSLCLASYKALQGYTTHDQNCIVYLCIHYI